ncbi:MAG: ACP S-malonyltransferase [Candidatus Marinimicrobia bacterium]|nr:ACP S-malonyltransferase [Candidatus Neomarinimicrobiota bacterium]MCH8068243.1 ACP S-malonyltransferase [Candidatus Neomarinimicrobiota bacterium]
MSLGFLFPGQGSQRVGMGRDLYENSEIGRRFYEAANEIMGINLARLSFEGPSEELKRTEYTQPSIFVVSIILSEMLMDSGTYPVLAAGHSLGEYTALTAAGVFSFEDGLTLVKLRGESMQKAGEENQGTMAAILGLDSKMLEEICEECSNFGIVTPANFNSQIQIVISGEIDAVKKAMELAKERGARKTIALNVSGAFHSSLMTSAKERIKETLNTIQMNEPKFPVVMNVTAEETTDLEIIRKNLIDQMDNPVRWIEIIKIMKQAGISHFMEVGPGRVLQGLNKRIDQSLVTEGISSFNQIFEVAHT